MYEHKNSIILKKLEQEQLPLLKELKDESWFGTHNISILNMNDQLKWFDKLDNSKMLVLVAWLNQEPIGIYTYSNIDNINRKYDQSHSIFKEHRGKKYSNLVLEAGIDFAFEVLNMNRIEGEVLENNIASLRSALAVGFKEEGLKRKVIYKCNTWLDSIIIGLIKDDWEKHSRYINYNGVCNLSYQPKDKK